MTEKIDTDEKKPEDKESTGFRINLPFGLGWLRGDGNHLTLLVPLLKWLLAASVIMYQVQRIVEGWKS